MGSSDVSMAAECHFENLVKDNCCCEGRCSHIVEDAWDIKMVMCLTTNFLAFSLSEILKKVLGNDAGKIH